MTPTQRAALPASNESNRGMTAMASASRRGAAPRTAPYPRPAAAPADAPLGGLNGPAQVILVTDQPALAEMIRLTLDHSRFAVRWVAATATAALACELPHLLLLDMDVEDLGGARVMERIGYERLRVARLPVIALTRRGDLKTKLAAFDLGVDDILTVPCSPEELLARCLALLRRLYGTAMAFAPAVQVGDLEIDFANRRVRVGTTALHLSPLELSLLYLLVANSGRLLTRDEIMDYLWGTDFIAESNVVDRHIGNLRTKLQDDWRRPRYIATVPGRGYRFVPVTAEGGPAPLPVPPEE